MRRRTLHKPEGRPLPRSWQECSSAGRSSPSSFHTCTGGQHCSCESGCGTSWFPELKNVRCDGSISSGRTGKGKKTRSLPEAKRWSTPVRKKYRSKPLPVQHHRYSRHAPDYTHFCQTSTCTVTITTSSYSGIADGWESKAAIHLPANKLVFLSVQH